MQNPEFDEEVRFLRMMEVTLTCYDSTAFFSGFAGSFGK